jgi:hypothetical protein
VSRLCGRLIVTEINQCSRSRYDGRFVIFGQLPSFRPREAHGKRLPSLGFSGICSAYAQWMHNGGIADFPKIKRKLQASLSDELFDVVNGNTDSEWAFALFLSQVRRTPIFGNAPSDF